jgi:hypothetical protein
MSKKLDSLAEYQRRVDLIMQEIADSEEKQLLARLRSLPAQDEDIFALRNGLRESAEQKGMTISEAHVEADDGPLCSRCSDDAIADDAAKPDNRGLDLQACVRR